MQRSSHCANVLDSDHSAYAGATLSGSIGKSVRGRAMRYAVAISVVLMSICLPGPAGAATRVYLLRGLMDVSTGLDALAARLRARGLASKVASYSDVGSFTNEAIRDHRRRDACPVIVVGHSMGAEAAVGMAESLKGAGVPVALLVSFSPAYSRSVPTNVARTINYFQSNSTIWANRLTASGKKSVVRNIDLAKDAGIDHFNMEKSPKIRSQVLSRIVAAAAECGTAGSAAQPASSAASAAQ